MSNPYLAKLDQLGFTWALAEVSGSTWLDHFGNHNGTIVGATVQTDPATLDTWGFPPNAPAALESDGIDDLVRVDHHADLQPTSEVTVALWVRTFSGGTGDTEDWEGYITKSDSTFQLRRNAGNNLELTLSWDVRGGTGGDVAAGGSFSTDYQLNVPRLVVATYDGSQMRVMINDDAGTMATVLTASRSGTIGEDASSDLAVFAQDNQGTLRRFLQARGALPALAPVGVTLVQAQELYDAAFEEDTPDPPTHVRTIRSVSQSGTLT